jgi:transcriptional regulator with XRE-family HTH domain
VQDLGRRLRALRNEQGLTLAQLGRRVGLSASYLSQIERGVSMPSLSRLTTIASALGVEIGHFFEDDVPSPCVVRFNHGHKLGSTADITIELLSAEPSDKEIQPYRVVCKPGASRDQPPTYPGEEFGFVLKGQLTVTVGEETFVLEAGDSIHYQTIQPHSWRNAGDEECIVIWAVWPPVSEAELRGEAVKERR